MSGGYELHQKLRTKAVRQLKRKDFDGAIASLYDGSKQLLETKEQGSGCDLACYLVDVYSQAAKPSNEENRKRIIDLISIAAPDFWRKKVIDAAVKWSTAVTSTPAGDGYLRLAIGDVLSKGGDYFASEVHYLVACSPPPGLTSASDLFPPHAPKSFACMMLDWLAAHGKQTIAENGDIGQAETIERIMAGLFALRGLLPLLIARSLTSSKGFMSIFVSRLAAKHPSILLPAQPNPKPYSPPGAVSTSEPQMLYLTANSELNFAQMALALSSQAAEHKRRTKGQRVPESLRDTWMGLFRQFEKEYQDDDEFIYEALPQLSQIYFDIQPPRGQGGNFMQEMLGNLMGGVGGGGQDGKSAAPIPVRRAAAPKIPKLEAQKGDDPTTSAPTPSEGELDLD